MTSAAPEIKGWCPGAHTPMASGDGLLIRAKTVGARLTATQAREIAAISQDCGNGLLDLSQRAQLQLRGIDAATLDHALRRLDAISLLAPNADAERVTNIVAAPLAGLDPHAAFDASALSARLARALQGDASMRALPAKFFFVIDGGGVLSLADIAADIRLEACADGGAGIAIAIAGALEQAVVVDAERAVATALELARAFLLLREDRTFDARRMKQLVAGVGPAALFRQARLEPQPHRRREATPLRDVIGAHTRDDVHYAGVATPFGRWRASAFAAIAELAARDGLGEIRLTPWRAILIPAPSHDAAQRIIGAAEALGLIVTPADPRLAVVACPGAPECPQAHGATRADLGRLAPLAQKLARADGVGLHVSGCAKGCARPGVSPVTLIARGARFDLIDNGAASDAPRLTRLSLPEVERELSARIVENAACPAP